MKSISLNKQKEIADLKAEIRNLANTLAESEYIRNDLEKGKNVLSSCLADEREQFKKECSIFNSSVAELTQKLEHSENERSNMNQTIQELKTKIVQLEKDKEALSSQLEENDQMERLTKEAIKNMGHQNQRRKVKYAETLKKIAPVMATPELDSSKLTQTPGKPRIPFKGNKRLSECMCPVCLSILLQPVTFPCNHSLCLKCYRQTVEKANLSCPVCRKRFSVWARKAAIEKKIINMEKWKEIQEAFPEKVRRRLEDSQESLKEDEEDIFEAQERRQISCPGVIPEYEAAIEQDDEAKKEEEASKALVEALQQEELNVEIEEKALVLEKKKYTKSRVERLKAFSSDIETDLRMATKLQDLYDLMDKKRIVDRSKGSSNEYKLRRKKKK
ncbi:E3 ubiquitin-protein ligase RNF168 [Biomphalaria pfeifferi]|uniref:RING-type E3 ubiquitin transferase n=2 Tax=Biomphalaria pfeifferi TaxID=112525 RepID=A0AAD8EXK6_BIOPF|nr:E3 ubiquitin-protein ligase RNF168 [Biomphalaria pfeifferi]